MAKQTQRDAVYFSMLQCVAVSCSVLQCLAVCCRVAKQTHCSYVASLFPPKSPARQCVVACCSVLQCAAVCCRVLRVLQCDTEWQSRLIALMLQVSFRQKVQPDINICTYLTLYIYRVAKQTQRIAACCSVL